MFQYNLIFQKTNDLGGVEEQSAGLGVIEYSHPLSQGDTVLLDPILAEVIHERFPEVVSEQLMVGRVIHSLPGPSIPDAFLVVKRFALSLPAR